MQFVSSVRSIFFGTVCLLMGASQTPAIASNLAQILICNDVPGADERLRCYDAAARSYLGLGPASSGINATQTATGSNLNAREQALATREKEIAKRELALKSREAGLPPDASDLAQRELAIVAREAEIKARETKLASLPPAKSEEEATLFGVPIPFTRRDPMTQMEALPNQKIERDDDGAIDAILVALREWTPGADGKLIFVLENGQVWRQIAGEAPFLRPSPKKPHMARISRGAMGSFNMSINDANRLIKVSRVDGQSKRSK